MKTTTIEKQIETNDSSILGSYIALQDIPIFYNGSPVTILKNQIVNVVNITDLHDYILIEVGPGITEWVDGEILEQMEKLDLL